MRLINTFVAALAVTILLRAAHADSLYSNFGPSDSYVGNEGWNVANGVDFGVYLEEAVQFTITGGDYFLNSAEVGAGLLFGPNFLQFSIYSDIAGAPGASLQSTTVTDQLMTLGTDPSQYHPPIVANFDGSLTLQDGQSYWLVLSAFSEPHHWVVWNINNQGEMGPRAWRADNGQWNTSGGEYARGVFRINGTPVPGPAMLTIMAMGGLLVRSRSRRV